MNVSLIALILSSILNAAVSAPAVSSVHVSFVSGNKATQYSHGTGAARSLVQYNLLSSPSNGNVGGTGDHILQKRSITSQPERGEDTRRQSVTTTYEPITLKSSLERKIPILIKMKMARVPISSKFKYDYYTTTDTTIDSTNPTNPAKNDDAAATTTAKTSTTDNSVLRKMMRTRVQFVDNPAKPVSPSDTTAKASNLRGQTVTSTMSGGSLLAELSTTTADALKAKNKKPKDSKAVKRSPFIAENFDSGGITFPDFDEFGGNEFGSLRNFGAASRGGGGRGSLGSHTHNNPESLSPDGVFLPPLPTEASEASDYENNDPYLADPDTAKYAAQHPPFFAAYPHKRAVLALNDQREANGLERNILRSIRPYFAFFESANHYHHNDILDSDVHDQPQHFEHSHYLPHHFGDPSNEFFNNLDPNHLLYAETAVHPQPMTTSWSVFNKK